MRDAAKIDGERFTAVFSEAPGSDDDHWVLDGSVLSRNGEIFVDLSNVASIAIGGWQMYGVVTERIEFAGPRDRKILQFTLRWKTAGRDEFDALKQEILTRLVTFQPRAMVDLRGDSAVRRVTAFKGGAALFLGVFCAALLTNVLYGNGQVGASGRWVTWPTAGPLRSP